MHAAGSLREWLLLSPVVAELAGMDVARQTTVGVNCDAQRARAAGLSRLAEIDIAVEVDDDSPTRRLASLMTAFERAIDEVLPELVVVAGAGDASLAAALAAARRGAAIAHLEAGVRSPDPCATDLHRLLTDRLADTLLAPTAAEAEHLLAEGVPDTRVHVVGRPDADVLLQHAATARRLQAWAPHRLPEHGYVLAAVGAERLVASAELTDVLAHVAARAPLAVLVDAGGSAGHAELARLRAAGARRIAPETWLEQTSLLVGAGAVVTDDGDLQDAASCLGIPCVTVGDGTDRPHTVTAGSNVVADGGLQAIAELRPLGHRPLPGDVAPWDGRAAERAARILIHHYVLVQPALEAAGR
jgi:UDP-N-acetylglucosamine 2-epimerase (non-hydrolysing)